MEYIFWFQLVDWVESKNFCLAVCYLPPATFSRGDISLEFFDHLKAKVYEYQYLCTFFVCGDFNARCGDIWDLWSNTPTTISPRIITNDNQPNSHSRSLLDFLKCTLQEKWVGSDPFWLSQFHTIFPHHGTISLTKHSPMIFTKNLPLFGMWTTFLMLNDRRKCWVYINFC